MACQGQGGARDPSHGGSGDDYSNCAAGCPGGTHLQLLVAPLQQVSQVLVVALQQSVGKREHVCPPGWFHVWCFTGPCKPHDPRVTLGPSRRFAEVRLPGADDMRI